MQIKYAIIGGGVAGLCAAIRLAELGEEPLVIESGSYPAHKVCGEFLSPECLPFLAKWGIQPITINHMSLNTSTKSFVFSFPQMAGGLSHLELDPSLANLAMKCGARVLTNAFVDNFQPKIDEKSPHLIQLKDGSCFEVEQVIIATGRIPSYAIKPPAFSYIGFKAHFTGLNADSLEMFSLPGAYLGIAPIEEQKSNVACLVKMNDGQVKSDLIENLIQQHPRLHARLSAGSNLFKKWMMAPVPSFGIKQTPDWLDAYFIGDAAVTIPPASGGGLSMAILGGRLAAEYAKRKEAITFKTMWKNRCARQVFWAKLLHQLMLRPTWGSPLLQLAKTFPLISRKIFEKTRQPSL